MRLPPLRSDNTYDGGVTPLLKSDGTPDCDGI